MERTTGIGGVFFKANDPVTLARWYEEHLGIGFGKNLYFAFSWRENNSARSPGSTSLGIFADESDYFDPSKKQLMLNLRVTNLEELLDVLKQEGVTVQDKTDKYAYGNFGWITDPEGNKIELWEPIESGFGEDENVVAERMRSLNRVTGVGGIHFKSSGRDRLIEWYDRHLGIDVGEKVHRFKWIDYNDGHKLCTSFFSIMKDTATDMEPSQKEFMINLRVKNLEGLMHDLKKEGVQPVGKREEHSYGNFGWIMDPEGNKIELWEAVDEEVEDGGRRSEVRSRKSEVRGQRSEVGSSE
jgi:predicted enzyme related to lactoylglutathione lyase